MSEKPKGTSITFHAADGTKVAEIIKLGCGTETPETNREVEHTKLSEWKCYLFGNTPDGLGMVWEPDEGCVPNIMIRWFMRIFLGCTWVKPKVNDE